MYRHVNKQNGKQYIGITKQKPENRWGVEGKKYKGKCPHFWNAIQKYGWNGFDHIIVASGLTIQEACDLEIRLIKEYNTQDKEFGYNVLEGGNAPSMPPEVRQKISEATIGRVYVGHPCSEEARKKIGDAQRGRRLTEEHKQRISEAKRGRPHKSPSEETRQKISDAHDKKPVYCCETKNTYPSVQRCAKILGLNPSSVSRCCKGKMKTTGGYHLKYAEN